MLNYVVLTGVRICGNSTDVIHTIRYISNAMAYTQTAHSPKLTSNSISIHYQITTQINYTPADRLHCRRFEHTHC